MRFMHIGDLHLGKSIGDFNLYEDQSYILKQIINLINENDVDALLIAGDVYDRSLPSEEATTLLDSFLCRLKDAGVKTFMISGNHDSDERLNYGSALFESNEIYISSVFKGSLYKRTVSDDEGEIDVYLLPFVKASQVRHCYPEANIETYDDAIRVIVDNANIDRSRRSVLVAHQFVTDGDSDPELSGSEGLAVKSVGLVEKISYKTLDSFDYVALGHIHSSQGIGRETIRYSGSPLKYSLSEVNHVKTVTIIDFKAKDNIELSYLPLTPLRDVRHLRGEFSDIINRDNITNEGDYVFVTLTDEDVVNDAMSIIQQYYKYAIKISYDNSHTRNVSMSDVSGNIEEKTFDELITEFYKTMYGCDISDDEMKLMKEVAKEAGIDETN